MVKRRKKPTKSEHDAAIFDVLVGSYVCSMIGEILDGFSDEEIGSIAALYGIGDWKAYAAKELQDRFKMEQPKSLKKAYSWALDYIALRRRQRHSTSYCVAWVAQKRRNLFCCASNS